MLPVSCLLQVSKLLCVYKKKRKKKEDRALEVEEALTLNNVEAVSD